MSDTSPPTKYTVGLVQMAMSADPAANLEQAIAKVAEAARAGARLVCLPELFRSRYFAQREDAALFDLAEPVPGPRTEALGRAGTNRAAASTPEGDPAGVCADVGCFGPRYCAGRNVPAVSARAQPVRVPSTGAGGRARPNRAASS